VDRAKTRAVSAKPALPARTGARQENGSGPIGGTQAIDRALAVLFAFRADAPARRAIELSQELGLNKSTVYRLLNALAAANLVRRPADATGFYRLGPAVLDLADAFVTNVDLKAEARPHLERLVEEFGESVNLAVVDGSDAIKIDSAQGTRTPQLMSRLGQRIPLVCSAAGKALLLDHSDVELRKVFAARSIGALTAKTLRRAPDLVRQIREARRLGWTVNDEESEVGMRAIGAPIRDRSGRIVASVSLSAPTFRAGDEQLQVLGRGIRDAAAEISKSLGNREAMAEPHRGAAQKTD
jgi:DNA-binding IclR family transcriptional regulator